LIPEESDFEDQMGVSRKVFEQQRSTRGRRAAVVWVAAILALAACTSTSGPNVASSTRRSTAAIPGPPSSPITVSSNGVPSAALPCAESIGSSPPDAGLTVALGVVGLPAGPAYPALQASDSGETDPAAKLFAKTGLTVRVGATFTITVPAGYADRARIGWGSPGQPTTRLTVDACPPSPAGALWLTYAGGYWVRSPMCLPVIVESAGRRQQVLVGVGTPCPGQQAVPSS
jgi:hypothetical protein